MAKEVMCDLCGEEVKLYEKMKDGTKICDHCQRKNENGYQVEWKKLTKGDFHYFDEIPVADESFQPDFDFEGFKADTKAGVFSINHHEQLFEFKSIKKYYITYIYKEINSRSEYKEIKGARLVIELDHPVIFSVRQRISRDKAGLLEMLDVLELTAMKSYQKHNEAILELLKKQTGKKMSLPKRENA